MISPADDRQTKSGAWWRFGNEPVARVTIDGGVSLTTMPPIAREKVVPRRASCCRLGSAAIVR
jgi:hypothetical protein